MWIMSTHVQKLSGSVQCQRSHHVNITQRWLCLKHKWYPPYLRSGQSKLIVVNQSKLFRASDRIAMTTQNCAEQASINDIHLPYRTLLRNMGRSHLPFAPQQCAPYSGWPPSPVHQRRSPVPIERREVFLLVGKRRNCGRHFVRSCCWVGYQRARVWCRPPGRKLRNSVQNYTECFLVWSGSYLTFRIKQNEQASYVMNFFLIKVAFYNIHFLPFS